MADLSNVVMESWCFGLSSLPKRSCMVSSSWSPRLSVAPWSKLRTTIDPAVPPPQQECKPQAKQKPKSLKLKSKKVNSWKLGITMSVRNPTVLPPLHPTDHPNHFPKEFDAFHHTSWSWLIKSTPTKRYRNHSNSLTLNPKPVHC